MKENTSEQNKGLTGWIDKRLPVFTFINHNLRDYPTPKNLNYFWNFGSLAGITRNHDSYRNFISNAIHCRY